MNRVTPAYGPVPASLTTDVEPAPRPRITLDPGALVAARDALAPFGPLSRQEPIEWAAEEPLAGDLADFYRYVGPEWLEVDTLGLPVLFFPLDRLWDEQAGYRWNHRTGALLVDWNEDWTVIAKQGADPFIHEATTGHVLMAPGEDGWEDRADEPEAVFRDVTEMARALGAVGAAWARFDDPFTQDWHLRAEVVDAVVAEVQAVLGSQERAADLARRLGYPAAG